MIKLFRSIQPVTFIFLVLYVFVLGAMYVMYPKVVAVDHQLLTIWAGLGTLLTHISPLALQVLGVCVIVFQAILLNRATNGFRLFEVTNFLTSLAFVTVTLFFASWISFNEIMLSSLFILFVMVRIFKMYGKEHALLESFDVGFLIGMATLFYAPSVCFIPAAFLSINTVKRLKLKEMMMVFLGCFTPIFLIFTPLFWFDQATEFFTNHFRFGWMTFSSNLYSDPEFIIKLVTISLFTLISGGLILSRRMQKVNRFRKTFQVIFVFLLFALISLLLAPNPSIKHFSVMILPISLYITFLFNEYSKSWISEVIHLVMLFVILFFQFQRFIGV